MMRRGFVAMTAAVLLLGAVATAGAAALTLFGLTFPERVADATLGSSRDFETENPGLGYGVRYEKPGWGIDMFIYDLTGWHNKFVKFRMTTRPSPRSSADARRFVEAWLKILWP